MPALTNQLSRLRRTQHASSPPADDTVDTEYYVLGGESVGRAVARRLSATGQSVVVVDETHDTDDIPGIRADPGDLTALAETGLGDAAGVVVATREDGRNLLIAQLVSAHFDVEHVRVLVNDPERSALVAAAGHDPISATAALADALVDDLDH